MVLAIYMAGAVFMLKKEQVKGKRVPLAGSFLNREKKQHNRKQIGCMICLLLLCILVGNVRARHVIQIEKENERYFMQYGDQKGQIKGFLYGLVEEIEIQKETRKIQVLLKDCYIDSVKIKKHPLKMKGKISVEWEESFAKQDALKLKNKENEEYKVSHTCIEIGDFIKIKGSFSLTQTERNPGEWDYRTYCYARGVGFGGWGEYIQCIRKNNLFFKNIRYQYLQMAGDILDRYMEKQDAGMVKAMLLGDKSSLDERERNLYQWSGIAHLLAVSGLHISLLGMGCWNVARKAGGSLCFCVMFSGSIVVIFGWLSGWSPSAQRAVFMFCLIMGAKLSGRTYDIWSALAFSLFWILWDSPRMMLEGGVQLSFGAVASIVGIGKIVSEWTIGQGEKQPQSALAKAIVMNLAVQWGTLPIICYWYFEFPPYTIVLNLLVIPFMGGILVSGLSVVLLGCIPGMGGLAVMAAGPAHYILKLYHFLCAFSLRLPKSIQVTGRPESGKMIVYYGILGGLLWYIFHVKHINKKKEERYVRKEEKQVEKYSKVHWSRMMILILLFSCCTQLLKEKQPNCLEIWFLDVGQGDGILIRTEKYNILLDGGSTDRNELGKYALEPVLKSMGIKTIDYAFVSHGDSDHISGLEYLLGNESRVEVKCLVLPKNQDDPVYERLKKYSTGKLLEFGEGDLWEDGKLKIYGLYPSEKTAASDRNNHSIVMLMEYGDCSVLFTGDIEQEAEEQLLQLYKPYLEGRDIDILKVAHHGSETSTGEMFLDAVSPKYAVLSYGKGNSYGHPSSIVLKRLQERNITIFSTSDQGAICLKYKKEKIQYSFHKGRQEIKLHG